MQLLAPRVSWKHYYWELVTVFPPQRKGNCSVLALLYCPRWPCATPLDPQPPTQFPERVFSTCRVAVYPHRGHVAVAGGAADDGAWPRAAETPVRRALSHRGAPLPGSLDRVAALVSLRCLAPEDLVVVVTARCGGVLAEAERERRERGQR